MAEVAAGVLVAEQVVATGVEAGVAAVAIATPTQPLKVSLEQLALPPTAEESHALARSHHTVVVIGRKSYIFGGSTPEGDLCSTDVYAVTLPTTKTKTSPAETETTTTKYECFPAFPLQSAETGESMIPAPRKQHAACAQGKYMVIHGGCDNDGKPIDEHDANCLWAWDSETLKWSKLPGSTQLYKTLTPRFGHHLFFDNAQNFFVLYGGKTGTQQTESDSTETETDTWLYDLDSLVWTVVPATSAPSAPATAAAYVDATLYTISGGGDGKGGNINQLYLHKSTTDREKPKSLVWKSIPFSPGGSSSSATTTQPSSTTPGTAALAPSPRQGAALVPLSTGYGRQYLVYMFGRSPGPGQYYSDIWTLQLPSVGFSAAAAKDVIRDHLPAFFKAAKSGEFSWAPVDLVPVEQQPAADQKLTAGKVHPGPRCLFGGSTAASSCLDGKGVVFWGGENAKGENESDGWILRLAYGYADSDRRE
ncbi:hypothetical protein B0H66DRAFT_574246 [Apodospora peruviana]|uniref:Uncharacterized protein n=1 Tax=Apodospora peruviana TaxID=516989 RepID=A0AAE0M721_9PEZI|nr:hypothetical protein B0H66DRAFT_574246 [Apodospora peruviana]